MPLRTSAPPIAFCESPVLVLYREWLPSVCAALCLALLIGCTASPTAVSPPPHASDEQLRQSLAKMTAQYESEFPSVPNLTVEELNQARMQGPVVLVDVRSEEEQAISMIPGAITVEQFQQKKETLASGIVVAYCTVGYRSSEFAEKLRTEGVDAQNLKGSIVAWCQARQPLETPTGESTHRVHVYGDEWNLVPEPYEAFQ